MCSVCSHGRANIKKLQLTLSFYSGVLGLAPNLKPVAKGLGILNKVIGGIFRPSNNLGAFAEAVVTRLNQLQTCIDSKSVQYLFKSKFEQLVLELELFSENWWTMI